MLNKRLGQHFLRDKTVLAAITAEVAPAAGQVILEIGPGDGALTDYLQHAGARVIALEIDRRFADKLQQRYANQPQVDIIHSDALAADWRSIAGSGARLVGNLPYNISTPLLLKMADNAGWLADCHVMVQKEVALRVCAAANTSNYGRLSVSLQLALTPQQLLDVPPSAFTPAPAVESAVIRLTPQTPPPLPPNFDELLAAAFNKRRKTLKNALLPYISDWTNCPVDGNRRAQELTKEEFIQLAKYAFNNQKQT